MTEREKEFEELRKKKARERAKRNYRKKINGKIRLKKRRNGDFIFVYSGGKAVHRVIAEKALGRKLKLNEFVHHIDSNALNNKHSNLIICSKSYHSYLHAKMENFLIGKNYRKVSNDKEK